MGAGADGARGLDEFVEIIVEVETDRGGADGGAEAPGLGVSGLAPMDAVLHALDPGLGHVGRRGFGGVLLEPRDVFRGDLAHDVLEPIGLSPDQGIGGGDAQLRGAGGGGGDVVVVRVPGQGRDFFRVQAPLELGVRAVLAEVPDGIAVGDTE